MSDALERVVTAELDALEMELVELRKRGSGRRLVVDVRVERRDLQPVTIDDCSRASRAIEARLDAGDIVGDRYVLEVSSPGVERALRTAAEWRRFTGRRANVLSEALGGRLEVEIVGVEGDPGGESVTVRMPGGDERRVPLAVIKEARLAFHWQR